MNIPKTVSVRQAMTITGFTRSHVYRLVHAGEWAFVKGDGRTSSIRIVERSIEAWFERELARQQQCISTTSSLDGDRNLPPIAEPAFS